MKFFNICLVAGTCLALSACGSKDPKEVRTISENTSGEIELTEDQMATALDWCIEAQEIQIENLKEYIDDFEKLYFDEKAYDAGRRVLYDAEENDDSEVAESKAYKERKDQLRENKQEIERLLDKLESLKEDMDDKFD